MMLNGQVALVTGASRGIGQAIALELGRLGATVIGTATSSEGRCEEFPRTSRLPAARVRALSWRCAMRRRSMR
jgi:NAD(P)-dependent dehydrogenase (short-subunit alcohol dehydrogenase family)